MHTTPGSKILVVLEPGVLLSLKGRRSPNDQILYSNAILSIDQGRAITDHQHRSTTKAILRNLRASWRTGCTRRSGFSGQLFLRHAPNP